MKRWILASVALVAAAGVCLGVEEVSPAKAADALFQAGRFKDAEEAYARLARHQPDDAHVVFRLGELALYANRLEEAQRRLEQAVRMKPAEKRFRMALAEVFSRRDDFRRAAPLLRAVGHDSVAKQLESFQGRTPYRLRAKTASTSLPFVVTDPLPLVRVRVNDSEEVNFLIDTGAAEVVLDPEFAKEVGAEILGETTGTFARGKQAAVRQGTIRRLALGDWTVEDLPVGVLNTRRFSGPIFSGRRVDGILGTVLFYHFLATLDYPHQRLVLSRKADKPPDAAGAITVPFWMAGDHYMVAWGRVEKAEPVLLFVDTGLAGGGVTLARSVIEEARVKLLEDQAGEGIGGGGRVRIVPFVVKDLSLGDAHEHNVRGLFSEAFPLETAFGFRIGGLVSHGFFRPYALTFDFTRMRLMLKKP